MSRKTRKLPPSPAQRRQRELSWAVYITEGAIANMAHLLAVNCVTFDDADKAVVNRAIEQMSSASEKLRRRMAQIK